MELEPAPPRPRRGDIMRELSREDLDLYAVEELQERIAGLQAEIERAGSAMARKRATRSAADALFSR